ncbi:ATP-binding protein [Atlantibacter subterranea]|uniref:ATP-binding protein n=1 Tax=Atlantibacter subterraneus TaxID=255519 RepID=UPI0020C2EB30|nr:ATP-binding protein [Atlantibacter subterranea]UTJ47986.1 ATP-binding protein [Atlantibacter subterranea]
MTVNNEERPFIRGSVAIESMRDNGYKDAAYALAELIDNSIQAGADNVQLMCFEHVNTSGVRNTKQIRKIGIFDNGRGMNKETLHLALEFGGSENRNDPNGMGKFGMGLPNSSISQCQRVDVWSWQNGGIPIHTYLDIEEMMNGELEHIPYPSEKDLPNELVSSLEGNGILPKSGTFVFWTKLDRLQWKTSSSVYKHSEALVGRMYRKYIGRDKVRITFKPFFFEEKLGKYIVPQSPEAAEFRANDPLYLTKHSSLPDLPGDLKGEEPFELKHSVAVDVNLEGEVHKVLIRVSIIKKEVLNALREADASQNYSRVGDTPWGKHFAQNIGISIVRSDRELETRNDFFGSKEFLNYQARYMGAEIVFGPALDKIFGVANNKQAAVNFRYMSIDDDYEQQGFDSADEYENDLAENKDPKLALYAVSSKVKQLISQVETEVKTLSVDIKKATKDLLPSKPQSVRIIEEKSRRRSEEGKAPDPDVPLTSEDKEKILNTIKIDPSVTDAEAKKIIDDIIKNKERFKIQIVKSSQTSFFDVTMFEGLTLLQLNENHLFFKRLMKEATEEQRMLLEISLGAWAQMEIEALSDRARNQFKFSREKWGEMLHDYLDSDGDEC